MINLKVDPKGLQVSARVLKAIELNLEAITSIAMNASMSGSRYVSGSNSRNIQTNLESSSKGFLDRPTKGVQKGWFQRHYASKRSLFAVLDYKDRPYPTYRYIKPHIFGVERKQKGYEHRLLEHPLSSGGIPRNSMLVPSMDNIQDAKGLKIDRFGNVTKASIDYIYNNVASTRKTGQRSSLKTKRESSNNTFLIGKPLYKSRPPGVYLRHAKNQKLTRIFTAVTSVDSKPIYLAEKVMKTTMYRVWEKNFEKAYKLKVNPWIR